MWRWLWEQTFSQCAAFPAWDLCKVRLSTDKQIYKACWSICWRSHRQNPQPTFIIQMAFYENVLRSSLLLSDIFSSVARNSFLAAWKKMKRQSFRYTKTVERQKSHQTIDQSLSYNPLVRFRTLFRIIAIYSTLYAIVSLILTRLVFTRMIDCLTARLYSWNQGSFARPRQIYWCNISRFNEGFW